MTNPDSPRPKRSEKMNAREIADYFVEKYGISVRMCKHSNGQIVYYFHTGFYKSDGIAHLIDTDGHVYLHTRYDSVDKIDTPMDVVSVSERWYHHSKKRYEGWAEPNREWAPLYPSVLG
jgi:hypothetical protein